MPWKERTVMSERSKFIAQVLSGEESFSEVCRSFGISRKTGYKWLSRALSGSSLEDLPRTPHHSPKRTLPEIEALILAERDQHPAWGGTYLEEQNDAFLNGGYNLFGVFADNLLAMVRTKVPAPFPESAFRHFKRRLFRDFLAENVLNLLILKRNSNFDTQSGWEIIRRHFGKEWYFLPDLAAVVARIGFRKLSGTHNKKA